MPLLLLITLLADEAPQPEDVKAGWTAFLVFVLLIAAVVFLGFSLVKQLRKAEAAKAAGVYDTDAAEPGSPDGSDRGIDHGADDGAGNGADSNGEPHRS
jgi:hypothetical protein